jgi:hypothetical protein
MLETTNSVVAVATQKGPHFARLMAMIDMEVFHARDFLRLMTNRAHAVLCDEHFVVLFKRQSVHFFQVVTPFYGLPLRPLLVLTSYLPRLFRVLSPSFSLIFTRAFNAASILSFSAARVESPLVKRLFGFASRAKSRGYFHFGTMPKPSYGGNSCP